VHPDFKVKLLEKYPKLTKQELKMCLLARLGIKTSEMARLLSLSERTVDSHRLNLRKKVGLKKDQSLTKFLTELK
jgi:AraC family transcriptional regulator, chitin signaling transcriptional activator